MTLYFHVTLLNLHLPGAFSVSLCICQQCLHTVVANVNMLLDWFWRRFWKSGSFFSPLLINPFKKNILRNWSPVNSKVLIFFSFWNAFLGRGWYLCVFDKWQLYLLSCCSVVLPIFHTSDKWDSPSLLGSKVWPKKCFHFQIVPILFVTIRASKICWSKGMMILISSYITNLSPLESRYWDLANI